MDWLTVSSPVALNLPVAMEEELHDTDDVVDVPGYLPQRRSPGQRSQDSGFSGYSDSSEGSSNNSPVPLGARKEATGPPAVEAASRAASRRSPLNLAEAGVLETDVDAPSSAGPCRHVSRVYIGDVICEKNIQPVNLSGNFVAFFFVEFNCISIVLYFRYSNSNFKQLNLIVWHFIQSIFYHFEFWLNGPFIFI